MFILDGLTDPSLKGSAYTFCNAFCVQELADSAIELTASNKGLLASVTGFLRG